MEQLDARIKNHDRDIERMCNFHYQGFIDSIRELLQVRTQAQKLNVSRINIQADPNLLDFWVKHSNTADKTDIISHLL